MVMGCEAEKVKNKDEVMVFRFNKTCKREVYDVFRQFHFKM